MTVTWLGALSADPGSEAVVLSWALERTVSHQEVVKIHLQVPPLSPNLLLPGSGKAAPPDANQHLYHTSVIMLAN